MSRFVVRLPQRSSGEAEGEPLPQQATVAALARTLIHRLRPYRCQAIGLLGLMAVQVAFENGLPLSLKYLIDDAIVPRDQGRLVLILAAVSLAAIMYGIAGVLSDRLYSTISSRVLNDLRREMFGHLQGLPLASFQRLRGGDLSSRFSGDLAAMETALTVSLPSALLSMAVAVVAFALLVSLQWQLALLTALGLPVAALFPRLLASRAAAAGVATRTQQSRIGAALQESVNGRLPIRTFGLRSRVVSDFEDRLIDLLRLSTRASFLGYLMERTPNLAIVALQITVLGAGAAMAIEGSITVGTLVAFNGLLLALGHAVQGITYALPGLIAATSAHHRIQDVLGEPLEVADARDRPAAGPLERGLELRDVSLAYESGRPVLDDVTLEVPRGAFLALVGGSGAGKTTLLELVLRLRDPSGGMILLDGRDVVGLDLDSLRRRMSVVSQEPFLFDVGIEENVRLARPEATDAEVQEACRVAGIHDFIASLPGGYGTKAGERGGRFSGGQRQRISIARAVLRRPDLLLLDEPTTALDPESEAEVNASLWRFAQKCTTICATHRVSTITHADRIALLEGGRVLAQGTHAELLASSKRYRALWNKQSGFVVGPVTTVEPRRLRDVPLLASLEDEQLRRVAALLATVHLPAREEVFRQGDVAQTFHMIARGRVEVLQEEPAGLSRIATLDDGDHFGEVALLRETRRTATVRTLVPTTFLVLRREIFAGLLDCYPAMRARISATTEERLARDARRASGARP